MAATKQTQKHIVEESLEEEILDFAAKQKFQQPGKFSSHMHTAQRDSDSLQYQARTFLIVQVQGLYLLTITFSYILWQMETCVTWSISGCKFPVRYALSLQDCKISELKWS